MEVPRHEFLQPRGDSLVSTSDATGALGGLVKVAEVDPTRTGAGPRPLTVELEMVDQPSEVQQLFAMAAHQAKVEKAQAVFNTQTTARLDQQQRSIDALFLLHRIHRMYPYT
jgi:hypothetical protein